MDTITYNNHNPNALNLGEGLNLEPDDGDMQFVLVDPGDVPEALRHADGTPDTSAISDVILNVLRQTSSIVSSNANAVEATGSLPADPLTSATEPRTAVRDRRQRRGLKRSRKAISALALGATAALVAADPASASAWVQSWGPNQSYIAMDVYGTGTFVSNVNTFNFAWGPNSSTVCRFQFAIRYTDSAGVVRYRYGGYNGGCVNGYAGAFATFRLNTYMRRYTSVCAFLYRDGAWYNGPCAQIR